MKILRAATKFLNPYQTPVMVADQPLLFISKKRQSKPPQTEFSEEYFLVILGAMHTETRGQPATIFPHSVRFIEIRQVHPSPNSHILLYCNGLHYIEQ